MSGAATQPGVRPVLCFALLSVVIGTGCEPPRARDISRLDEMETLDLTAKENTFHLWIADNPGARETGLMNVPAETMATLEDGTHRGMLFVFPADQPAYHGFYMKSTIIPLDIAFIRLDGTIVSVRTMVPHDLSLTTPTASYRFAIEVNANLFADLDINAGDAVQIPESVLNNAQ